LPPVILEAEELQLGLAERGSVDTRWLTPDGWLSTAERFQNRLQEEEIDTIKTTRAA
jgi:hypothetical protein